LKLQQTRITYHNYLKVLILHITENVDTTGRSDTLLCGNSESLSG